MRVLALLLVFFVCSPAAAQECFSRPVRDDSATYQNWQSENGCGFGVTLNYTVQKEGAVSSGSIFVPPCAIGRQQGSKKWTYTFGNTEFTDNGKKCKSVAGDDGRPVLTPVTTSESDDSERATDLSRRLEIARAKDHQGSLTETNYQEEQIGKGIEAIRRMEQAIADELQAIEDDIAAQQGNELADELGADVGGPGGNTGSSRTPFDGVACRWIEKTQGAYTPFVARCGLLVGSPELGGLESNCRIAGTVGGTEYQFCRTWD